MLTKKTSLALLVTATILMVIIGMLFNPIPQPEAFHNFADQRSWLGITNAWNVLSNILFAFTGVWGLFLLFTPGKLKFIDNRERWLWIAVSIGLLLTAIGSSYYHLAPNNFRLVFDRLPMTFVFMSYAAALISERINITLGLCLWPLLAFLGFVSVLYWHATEWRGAGDLRFYLGIQLFAILTTLVMLLTPSHYTRAWDLAIVILLYGAAILVERLDHQIYMFTGNFISGHTLKHLLAGLAGLWLIRMISTRKIIIHDSKKGI